MAVKIAPVSPTLLVELAVGGIALYALYKALQGGQGIIDKAVEAVNQAAADAQSAWTNNVSAPFQRGQDYAAGNTPVLTDRQVLYSNAGYDGVDPNTGEPVLAGEWYGNATARAYSAQLQTNAPQVKDVGTNGLTTGYYLPGIMTKAQRDQIQTMATRGRVVGGY